MEPQNTTPPDKTDEGDSAPEVKPQETQPHTSTYPPSPPDWHHDEPVISPSEPIASLRDDAGSTSFPAMNQPASGAVQPAAGALAPTPATADPGNQNAGLIVLQWLTYAFWGWALLALSSLTASILANFITKAETGSFIPYAIAAVLVLLPAAFICEHFYSKKEPVKKTGAALAVMVIHAVIFALFAVGALITAVFVLVSMLVSSGDIKDKLVVLFSALIISVYYLLTFVRTLNIQKLTRFNRLFRFIMLVTVGVIIILGIVGPVARERSLRNDRLLGANLSDLSRGINDYTQDNGRLPESLAYIDVEGDAQKIIDRNLVEYNKIAKPTDARQTSSTRNTGTDYYYEICATFKEESTYYERSSNSLNSYNNYISADSHPAGRHCFKAKATVYTTSGSSGIQPNQLR